MLVRAPKVARLVAAARGNAGLGLRALLEHGERTGPPADVRAVARARHVARRVGEDGAAPIDERAAAVALARVLDPGEGVSAGIAVRDARVDRHRLAREGVDVERAAGDVVFAAADGGPARGEADGGVGGGGACTRRSG